MAKKSDKFGIKFWICAEVESKYAYNVIPYLGADENQCLALRIHVVMQLMKPLFGKGYNVMCDNFFVNKKLAQQLLQQCATIVGTVRANRWELPPTKKLEVYPSQFFQADGCHHKQVSVPSVYKTWMLEFEAVKLNMMGRRRCCDLLLLQQAVLLLYKIIIQL